MSFTTFAAIDVGSNELAMKIFQLSKKNGITELEFVRHTIELGSETYTHGKLSYSVIDELCAILGKFAKKMKEYQVVDYIAYATSGLREASNQILVLDQIKLRTGLIVTILSNSEQRFLCYKALSFVEPAYQSLIEKGTAIIDVGAGSIQISLFNHNALIVTQNIKLGSLRIRELLANIEKQSINYMHLLSEYIENDLSTFEQLFLSSRKIKHIIGFGDQIMDLVRLSKKLSFSKAIPADQFSSFYHSLTKKTLLQLSMELGVSKEQASLLLPTAMIYQKMMEKTNASELYFTNLTLCDGIVSEFAIKNDNTISKHNFEEDILEASRTISKRYHCDTSHSGNVETLALQVFDNFRKLHGLGKRERLYLQIAIILHGCGKFINMNEANLHSYHIIMSTEIIGLSHKERELIANLVLYTTSTFPNYDSVSHRLEKDSYLVLAKLSAIFRLANSLDKSHKQKFSEIRVQMKDHILQITTNSLEDIKLEQDLFNKKADFFEEVYGIRPKLKHKRSI